MRKTDPFMWPHAGISAKGTAAPGSAPDCKFFEQILWQKLSNSAALNQNKGQHVLSFQWCLQIKCSSTEALLGSQPKSRALLTLPSFQQAASNNRKWSSARGCVAALTWHYISILAIMMPAAQSLLPMGEFSSSAWKLTLFCMTARFWVGGKCLMEEDPWPPFTGPRNDKTKGKEVPSKKVSNSLMPALRASCQLSVTKKGTSTPPFSKEASRGKNGTIVATVAHSDLLHEKPYWK